MNHVRYEQSIFIALLYVHRVKQTIKSSAVTGLFICLLDQVLLMTVTGKPKKESVAIKQFKVKEI